MIGLKRDRTGQSVPSDFSGLKLIKKHEDLIERFFAGQTAGKPISFVSSKWKNAKGRLKQDTAEKCAYCEAPTSVVAHGDVEHFRPKSLYWWLAYSFDNYLFSCQICNQLYKGDNFPVSAAARLAAPGMPAALPVAQNLRALADALTKDATKLTEAQLRAEWDLESADLVHPYLEDPESLFIYEADDSNREIWTRAAAAAGARAARALDASEKFLGINRESLRRQRYVDYDTARTLVNVRTNAALSQSLRQQIDQQLAARKNANFPFAGMHRFFLKQWGV